MSEGLPHERAEARYVVLDDDPTGVQTLAGIHVLLAWGEGDVRAALGDRPSVHLVTNARALAAERARAVTASAARAALAGAPDARIVLRGDSTLRGHLREEVEAARLGRHPGSGAPAPARARAALGGKGDRRRVSS